MEAHKRPVRNASCAKRAIKGIWGLGPVHLPRSSARGATTTKRGWTTGSWDIVGIHGPIASDLPILLDGDNGLRQLQQHAPPGAQGSSQRGIARPSAIEDKQFPKTNSFLNGGAPAPWRDIAEFAGPMIAAGKDTQNDPNFLHRCGASRR